MEEIEQLTGEEQQRDTAIAKCPSCGANMVFSPEKGELECPYCGPLREIKADASVEIRLAELMSANNTWSSETHVFRCQNCGATQVIGINEISKACSFCGTTNIVETDEIAGVKPNAVVPFAITVKQAVEKVKAWAKKKFFAPMRFKKEVKPENINGVYNPAFTFDTQTYSTYHGVLGKYYYVTRTVNGKTQRVRKIRYYSISGNYDAFFDDVLIQASSSIEQKYVDKMQPFETNDSKEYTQEYLNGFSASQYERDGMACWELAKQTIHSRVKSMILAQYSYDVVSSFSVNVACENITYKYILLPVYVGHCKWNKKNYNFYVNGKNGKVSGKTPVSALKVIGTVLLGLAVVAGIIALVYLLE